MKRLAIIIGLLVASIGLAEEPVIRVGDTRLTVITPNLIRIEQSPNGRFIDEPSMFAINRKANFTDFKIERERNMVVLTTSAIKLWCDGRNVGAAIRKGEGFVEWKAGAKNSGNLGGTIRTLDGVSGPVDLGEGVLSRDGWYLLDDSRTPLLTADWVRSRPADAGTDWYLFGYGTDYKAALKSLTTIGGPVPMPRKYLLGAWYSRYWPYTSDDYRQIVREYAERDFPLDVIVMDMDWHITDVPDVKRAHAGQVWTGYTWDRKLLPDAEKLIEWFHEQGLRVTLNDHPADGVQPHESMYEAFMREMGKDPSTREKIPFDAGDKKYLDTFWKHTHEPLLKAGVDFWWLDWQQFPFTRSIPEVTNLAWLNTYYFKNSAPEGMRRTSFSRWAGWGDHRHPIHFSGDMHTGWGALAFEVPFTSTAGNVGCLFWSHDIGGHMGGRNEESYARWCQFGATTAALRSHSTRNKEMDRRPWTYPKWAEDSMQASFHLRSQLFPYIYSSVRQSTRDSVPLNRMMYFDYPDDEQAYLNPQQYMFGDHLLVAPITTAGTGPNRIARQAVWFPKGWWLNYFTGERIESEGTSERLVSADINQFPLYFRGGVPVPMQPYAQRMTTAKLETLVVKCYPGPDKQLGKFELYEDDGVSDGYARGEIATTELTYSRDGDKHTFRIAPTKGAYAGQPQERAYEIVLAGVKRPSSEGVTYDATRQVASVKVARQRIDREARVEITAALAGAPAQRSREGIGPVATNDGPYGFGGRHVVRFYAARGLIDGDRFTWVVGAARGDATVSDRPFELPQARSSGDEVSFRRTARVEFRIDGNLENVAIALPYDAAILHSDRNIARRATVTASSTEKDYDPKGAIDGKVSGYAVTKSAEWASDGEKQNATIKLEWPTPQTIEAIALFDRPNSHDQILAGEISFSDGGTINFGPLPNDASEPLELKLPPRTVTWLILKVTQSAPETQNTGLSEIAVFSHKQ